MLTTRRGLLLLGGALVAGCGLVSFDIEQDIPEQTVQGGLLGNVLPPGLFDLPLDIDIESQTKARGTGPATSANLKSVTLAMTAPPGETFEFLDSLVVSMAGGTLPEVEVARLRDVPPQPRVSLEVVPSVDLLPYIKAGARMKASATGKMPRQTVKFNGKVVVTVTI
jgi:hypothetical protein